MSLWAPISWSAWDVKYSWGTIVYFQVDLVFWEGSLFLVVLALVLIEVFLPVTLDGGLAEVDADRKSVV